MGEKSNEGKEAKDEKWYQKGKCVVGLITFVGIIIFGTFWIILYALQAQTYKEQASIFAVAALLGGGFFTCGCLLGFMFGIPKLRIGTGQLPQPRIQPEPPQAGPPKPEPPVAETPEPETSQTGTPTTSILEVNTNLEQVSDWLTKIVVGVSLTQIHSIPQWLKDYAKSLSSNLGGFPNAQAFAVGLLIYYLTFGFLSGYLLTRLYLKDELEEAERAKTGKGRQ